MNPTRQTRGYIITLARNRKSARHPTVPKATNADPDGKSARFKRTETHKSRPERYKADDYIYGFHSVSLAISNPARQIKRIFATPKAAERLPDPIMDLNVPLDLVTSQEIEAVLGDRMAVHQGIAASVVPLKPLGLEDCHGKSPLMVLDQVTDPHNVGAILRSAAAFNAAGLVMTSRNSPALSGSLAKAASGALELVPVIHISNLSRALKDLADMGFWRIGLDGNGSITLEEALSHDVNGERNLHQTSQFHERMVLVLGAEGKGLRRLTKENCDEICRLNTSGRLKSLNVSNAAAIALHTLQQYRNR